MAHRWKFARVGGFDQVQLETGRDLVAIGELDQKLWVALACPIRGLELDARTLALIDGDADGRVRASELIAAVKWIAPLLEDVEVLAEGAESIALSAIDGSKDEGKLLLRTAKKILATLGKPDATEISVADMLDAIGAFEKDRLNGDGVVPLDTASDEALKKAITDILACTAAPPKDKSGKDGVDEATIKSFFEAVRAHAEWLKRATTDERLRAVGDDTASAFAAYSAVKAKIDDYFARARVAAYDARALAAVNGEEKAYLEIAAKDLHVSASEIVGFPLAQVAVDKPLPLTKGVNPAWADKVGVFVSAVVQPLLGEADALTEADWKSLCAKLEPYGAYVADKKGASVEKLGPARVEELASSDLDTKLLELVAEDLALAPEAQAIERVERLVRYHRDLMEIANNFVAFRDFYAPPRHGEGKKLASFQVGTLYLDTRACELCVEVIDAGKHATMAPLANTYLVYCDLKNSKGETRQIAAAMTAGDVDNLMVGRNGVFYDRQGHDWDATVTKIIDNPISVRQAFWSPYKKALRMVEEFVASRAAAAQADADAKLTSDVGAATTATTTPPAPGGPATPPTPATRPLDIGVVAALGVAVGGITAALGALLEAFFGLGIWMPLGVLGLILAISGPSMAVAWLKLRKRNLGPILDANGWALNAMALVNVPLGESLTKLAVLPEGSDRNLSDPFAEEPRPWGFYLTVIVVLALAIGWYLGSLDPYLPGAARSTTVLGANAPAYVAPDEDASAAEEAPAAD